MFSRKLVLMGALLAPLFCGAQTADFNGTWKVTWMGAKRPLEAKMVIKEDRGTWKTYTAVNKSDMCVGKEVPIRVERTTENEASVLLQFSEVVDGCKDVHVSLKMLGDKSMTGMRGGSELTVVRD